MSFQQVKRVGTRYVAIWVIETELTEEQYRALGQANPEPCPGQPHKDAKWYAAEERPVYDTVDGLRKDGDVLVGNERVEVVLAGGKRLQLDKVALRELSEFVSSVDTL